VAENGATHLLKLGVDLGYLEGQMREANRVVENGIAKSASGTKGTTAKVNIDTTDALTNIRALAKECNTMYSGAIRQGQQAGKDFRAVEQQKVRDQQQAITARQKAEDTYNKRIALAQDQYRRTQIQVAKDIASEQNKISTQAASAQARVDRDSQRSASKQDASDKKAADKYDNQYVRANDQVRAIRQKVDQDVLRSKQVSTTAMTALDQQRQRSDAQTTRQIEADAKAQIVAMQSLDRQRLQAIQGMTRGEATNLAKGGAVAGMPGYTTGPNSAIQNIVDNKNIPMRTSPYENWVSDFSRHLLQWGSMIVVMEVFQKIIQAVAAQYQEMIQKGSEFQIQGVLFQANQRAAMQVGMPSSGNVSNEALLIRASALARQYGDEVNNVVQDLSLWYKRVGDINAASAMTNETLKFQMATGANLEDIYKTLTGLAEQAAQMPMDRGNSTGFTLKDTPQLLREITAEAVSLGAGLHIANEQGQELAGGTNNAAILYMKALDQDAAALKTMGYSMSQAVEINAALIQSFGNSGGAASEAGDRLARLAGGFAQLSNPSTVKAFEKQGFSLKELNQIFNTSHDVIGGLAKAWHNLTIPQMEAISLVVAGKRQYEALQATLEAYKTSIGKAQKALEDKGAEDRLANDMAGTYMIATRQLSAAWESFSITLGNYALPALTAITQALTNSLPSIEMFINRLGDAMHMRDMAIAGQPERLIDYTNQASLIRNKMRADKDAIHSGTGMYFDMSDRNYKNPNGGVVVVNSAADRAAAQRDLAKEQSALQQLTAQSIAERRRLVVEHPELDPKLSDYQRHRRDQQVQFEPVNRYGMSQTDWEINYQHKHKGSFPSVAQETAGFHPAASSYWALKHPEYNSTAQGSLNDTKFFAELSRTDPELEFKLQMARAHLSKSLPVDKSGSMVTPQGASTSSKGLTKDYQQEQTALTNLKDDYSDRLVYMQSDAAQTEENIRSLDRNATTYGMNASTLAKLTAQHQAHILEMGKENSVLKEERDAFAEAEASARVHANSFGKNTEEYRGWITVAHQSNQEMLSIQRQLNQNTAARDADTDSILRNNEEMGKKNLARIDKNYNSDWNVLAKQYKIGQTSVSQEMGFERSRHATTISDIKKNLKGQDQQDAIDTETERWKQNTQAILDNADALDTRVKDQIHASQDSLLSSQFKTAGFDRADETYYRSMIDLQKQQFDFKKAYDVEVIQAGQDPTLKAEVQTWASIEEQAQKAGEAAAIYERNVTRIKDSALYQASEKAFTTVSTSIGEDVTAGLFGNGKTDDTTRAIDTQIAGMNNLKLQEQLIYDSRAYHSKEDEVYHTIRMQQIDEELRLTDRARQQEQNKLSHPTLLKKAAQDFTKSLVDDFMKQLETKTMNNLFKLGNTDNAQEKAIASYEKTTKQYLIPAISDQNPTSYYSSTQVLNTAMGSFGTFVGQFNAGISQLGAIGAGSAPSGGGSAFSMVNNGAGGGAPGNPFAGSGSPLLDTLIAASGFGAAALAAQLPSTYTSPSFSGAEPAGISPNGQMQYMDAQGNPMKLNSNGSFSAVSGGSRNHWGYTSQLSGVGGLGKDLGVASSLYGIYSGYQQGGINGGLSAGMSAFQMTGNPYIAAAVFAISALHHKDNPADMPDKYDTTNFTRMIGELTGSAGTGYGPAYNPSADPVQQQLGAPMLSYIETWIAKNINSTNPDMKNLAVSLQAQFGTTGNGQLTFGTNIGQEQVTGGSLSGSYTDIYNAAENAANQIQQLSQAAQSLNNQLVAINQYGSSTGFLPYIWNTPGYQYPAQPLPGYGTTPPSGTPTAPTAPGSNPVTTGPLEPGNGPIKGGGGGGPGRGGGQNAMAAYRTTTYSPSSAPTIVVHHSVTLPVDGRVLAKSNQSYVLRARAQGYQRVS
jgi:hypothetical protein